MKSISVEFLSSSGSVTTTSTVEFSADTTEWQYGCGVAVAAHRYSSIRIKVNATRCIGITLVDGLQLYREEFSQAYTYDSKGNLTGYKSLIGQQNSFEYDRNDNIKSSTDPRGNTTTYTHDTHHNLTGSESAEHVKSAYTVNSKGQTTRTTIGDAALFIETETAYDSDTALTETVTDARGKTVSYGYDSATRATTLITDPKGNTSTYIYGNAAAMHRLASITSTGLGVVEYTYDTYGKLAKIKRGSTEYKLTYDTWNRPLETMVGTTALSTNTYDSCGKLLTVTYAGGFSARYEYDDLDRVSKIYQTENNLESLVYGMIYNGEGDLYEIRNHRTGRASFFDYDHSGRCMASKERLFTVTNGVISYGNVISSYAYRYDECNNLTKLTCSVAGSGWSTTYTYDKDNRPKATTLSSGKVITNTYDAIGRLENRKIGLNSDYITSLTYVPGNGTNKTTGLVATYQNGSDTAYAYVYDDNGNITSITRGTVSVTYEYNGANELIRENNGFTNQTVTYTYDLWGNLTEKNVYAYTTAADPGTPISTILYGYTNTAWGDQLTSYDGQTIVYDAMGNPTSYRGKGLAWHGKQLTGVSGGTHDYSFTYDSNGLRQQKTEHHTDPEDDIQTNYYYNGSVLIGLTKGTDTLRFSYDAAGLVQAVDFNGTYYYYLRNGQGDIVKLIDGNRNTVVEYAYDSWGKQLSCTGTLATTLGALNPFRYRGYVYDEETQWYYLKSRYYDPETCRFISADVLLSTGQGVLGHNCYAYCGNNPIHRLDSEGRFFFTIIGAITGGIVGGISAAIHGEDVVAGIAGGAAMGAVAGLATDVTAATGGAGLGLGAAIVVGAVSAGVGEATTQVVHNVNRGESFQEATSNIDLKMVVVSAATGALTGGICCGVDAIIKSTVLDPAKDAFVENAVQYAMKSSSQYSNASVLLHAATRNSLLQIGADTALSIVQSSLFYHINHRSKLYLSKE